MLKRLLLLAPLALLTPVTPAHSAGRCGFTPVDGAYLTSISHLRNVSCADAKRVYTRVERLSSCKARQSSRGWAIRHRGSRYELHLRFTKGRKAFEVTSQGSCA